MERVTSLRKIVKQRAHHSPKAGNNKRMEEWGNR
jgi:hypothetical protein